MITHWSQTRLKLTQQKGARETVAEDCLTAQSYNENRHASRCKMFQRVTNLLTKKVLRTDILATS